MTETSKLSAENISTRLPKRLGALMALYAIASGAWLWLNPGNLFAILILFLVLAVVGRQKAGLFMLRGFVLVQLAIIALLPVLTQLSEQIQQVATRLQLDANSLSASSYLVMFVLVLMAGIQIWIAFTPKVAAYFNRKMNMNIMS